MNEGTEAPSSLLLDIQVIPHFTCHFPPQVHEGVRQAVDEGCVEGWERKVAQVSGKGGRGEEKE